MKGRIHTAAICAVIFGLIILFSGCNRSGEPSVSPAELFLSRTPIPSADTSMTLEAAYQAQAAFVKRLQERYGPVVGYKVGLTSQKAQQRFGVHHPIMGVLLERMLLPQGATISTDFGARPMFELDLLVRVGDERINQARTTAEALQYLDAVIPFIELPDLAYAEDVPLNAAALVAVNAGARLGIMGDPIPITPEGDWLQRLSEFEAKIAQDTTVIGGGFGRDLLGHPLNAVMWLKNEVHKRGMKLKKGDLLSLGGLTPPQPVKPGSLIRARYMNLDPRRTIVEISVLLGE